MKTEKKVIAALPKCYAICQLEVEGRHSFLIATEKEGECQRFNSEGEYLETIWTEPGGVMTMQQLPGGNGAFLATHRFYSPNDAKAAGLVLAEPIRENGAPVKNLEEPHRWQIRQLTPLPFLHRFDILPAHGSYYLIACCLKSDHEFKEDWNHPGRIYVCELPKDLSPYNEKYPLPLTILKEGLTKNHGYGRCLLPDGRSGSLIATENGIFRVLPPAEAGADWSIEMLTNAPASDCTEADFDGDGVKELLVFAPFHGSELTVLKPGAKAYESVYCHGEPLEFLHAIWSGTVLGETMAIIGYRKGRRELLTFYYDRNRGHYATELLDADCGPANVSVFEQDGHAIVIAANRESDEAALYRLSR